MLIGFLLDALRNLAAPGVWMGLVVQLAAPPIGYVRVELGRREIGVPEHLLDASEVGSALEQVGGERVAQQVRMDALGLQAGAAGEPAEDQERAGAGERAALRVQEELRPVPAVEVGPAAREVPAQRLGGLAADGDDALLPALAHAADEPALEVDAPALERHRLRDAKAGAVQELGERAVAEVAWLRAGRGLEEPLRLRRGQRPRQAADPPRQLELGRRVVLPRSEERLVPEEGAKCRRATGDRGGGEAARAQGGDVPLEVVDRCSAERLAEELGGGG